MGRLAASATWKRRSRSSQASRYLLPHCKTLITFSILVYLPMYDRVILPTARALSGKPWRLQTKRLHVAMEYGLVDLPETKLLAALGAAAFIAYLYFTNLAYKNKHHPPIE